MIPEIVVGLFIAAIALTAVWFFVLHGRLNSLHSKVDNLLHISKPSATSTTTSAPITAGGKPK